MLEAWRLDLLPMKRIVRVSPDELQPFVQIKRNMTTCRNEALAAKRFPGIFAMGSDSCFLQSDFSMFARPVIFKNDLFAFLRRSVTKTRYLYEVSSNMSVCISLFSFLYRATKIGGTFPIRGVDTKIPRHHRVFRLLPFYFHYFLLNGACFLTAIA